MAPTTASPSTSTSTPAARPRTSRPASALDPAVQLPAVLDLVQADALLGVGRTTAYRLVYDGEWPTPVLRLGRLIKIPTQPLLELLAGATRETARRNVGPAGRVAETGPLDAWLMAGSGARSRSRA
jgi:hypothetical protein